MGEGETTASQEELDTYYHAVDKNPHDSDLWTELFKKAREEERNGKSLETLPGISCYNLLELHGKLIDTPNTSEKFEVLSLPAPDGKIWHEHILGKTNRAAAQFLLDFIQNQDYAVIVDVGAGSGDSLVPATAGRKVIGVDISRSLLHSAKHKNPTTLVQSDATKLPIAANSADCMYSHGLTHYFSLTELKKLALQAKRVLKPGGKYLEAWSSNETGKVPESEKHLAKNYKSLLILILDRIVTADGYSATRSFDLWREVFESQGFEFKAHQRGNDAVIEFRKPYSEELEDAVSGYQGGGMIDAGSPIDFFLFPHRFESLQGDKRKPLTLDQWKIRLEEYRRFAKDPRTIQMIHAHRNFYSITIAPLLAVLNGDEYSQSYWPETISTIEHNLEIFINNFADIHSHEYSHRKDRKILEELLTKIENNPQCKRIAQRIKHVLEG